ncbi:lanthionine synthetase, partial [Streptomyces durbertensis]
VPRQPDAITTAAHWLLTWAEPDHTWPPHISGTNLDTGPGPHTANAPGRRTAWCYGTPGIATALTHAAHALNDRHILNIATAALHHIATHPDQWDTEGPTLCHGTAGILQAAKHHNPQLAHHVAIPQPHSAAPGLLNGTAGTALALADHGGLLAHPRTTTWDAVLLLS